MTQTSTSGHAARNAASEKEDEDNMAGDARNDTRLLSTLNQWIDGLSSPLAGRV